MKLIPLNAKFPVIDIPDDATRICFTVTDYRYDTVDGGGASVGGLATRYHVVIEAERRLEGRT